MYKLNLKPTHKPVVEYYSALEQFNSLGIKHEGAFPTPTQKIQKRRC